MYHNKIYKNYEKGVSLIITFFILTIMLAIVLSIGILLYSQIKVLRNIGNSVVAFYAADSGVEKVLYYDRQKIPVGGTRGLCNINNVCPDCTPGVDCAESKCQGWLPTGNDCNLTCGDCVVSFNSFFDDKSYNVEVSTITAGGLSTTNIDIKGNYQNVSRKIQLKAEKSTASTCSGTIDASGNCWYKGNAGESCTAVCVRNGKITVPNSRCIQADPGCTVLQSFSFDCSNSCDPDSIPYHVNLSSDCSSGDAAASGDWCAYSDIGLSMICVCQ